MLDFLTLAQQCAPTVEPQTMAALVHVESRFNPLAIGVVGGYLERQPKTIEEAVSTAKALADGGWNFSMGMAQVNRYNLSPYKLDYQSVFDPCANLRAGAKILEACYTRAKRKIQDDQAALEAAFSCYYSGNLTRGFKPDKTGDPSYVQKVLAQADVIPPPIRVVPSLKGNAANPPKYDKAATSSSAQPPARAETVPIDLPPEETTTEAEQREAVSIDALKSMPPPSDAPMLAAPQSRLQAPGKEDLAVDSVAPVRLQTADHTTNRTGNAAPDDQRRARSQSTVF